MSHVVGRRLCTHHIESTPSLVVYSDGTLHCFGCGWHSQEDLGQTKPPPPPKPPENLEQSLGRISKLSSKLIRGLTLPYCELGFYLVWPNANYYLLRRWEQTEYKSKYRCPSGHPRPLLLLKNGGRALIVIEGETNALSLQSMALANSSVMPVDICSPGSANELYRERDLTTYARYERILILADADTPGALGAIALKVALQKIGKPAEIKLMEQDANELLVSGGLEAWYAREILPRLGMP